MSQSAKKAILWGVIICSLMWIICLIVLPDVNLHNNHNKPVAEIRDSVFTEICIDHKVIDLGDVPADSVIYADYGISNIGDNVLVIHKVNPDCSCTDYTIDRMNAKPNEKIKLQLKVDTHHKIGDNIINVMIRANTFAQFHMLKLKFNVLFDFNDGTDGIIQFDRPVINLGEIPLGENRDTILKAVNCSEETLVLLDVYSSCDCTKVIWDKKPIKSKEYTVLKVNFSAEQTGTFLKKIAVRHSAAIAPVTFAIQGTVCGD